jgi:hypothetical protein
MSRSGSLFHRGLRRAASAPPRVAVTLALTLVGLSPTACYEAKPLHLTIQTAATTLDCARTADRVFFDASYVRMSNVLGPNVFYTPRVSPPRQTTTHHNSGLGWGIGVWVTERTDEGRACGFALEGLSPDPDCGPTCPYSPQRGDDVDEALRDMTRRLAAAFE